MYPEQTPRSNRNRPVLASRAGLLASAAAIAILAFAAGATTFPQSQPAPVAQVAMTAPAPAAPTPASTVALPGRPGSFADLVARIKPAVVSVSVRIPGPAPVADSGGFPNPFAPFGAPRGQGGGEVLGEGSGFFISADGYAVTNNHVVDHASEVAVTTDDGKVYKARVIGTDPGTDLAVIKVDGRRRLHPCRLRRPGAEGRRLGGRGRQSLRPRQYGDRRHRLGARSRRRRQHL